MGTTIAELQGVIKSNLGIGGRAVELTTPDLDRGIKAALNRLAKELPETGYTTIPVTATIQKYLIDKPGIIGVTEVVFFNNGGRLILYPYPDAAVDHYLIMGEIRDQQKTYGDLPEWEWVKDTDPNDTDIEKTYVLIMFNNDSFLDRVGRIPTHIAVTYKWALVYSDDKKTGLPRLRADLQDWVERYSTAFCRRILGDIRGKFMGIPGPNDGEMLPIDAAGLIERATTEIKELEEELRGRRRQLPLMID